MVTKRKVKVDNRQTNWSSLNDVRQQSVAARQTLLTYMLQKDPVQATLLAGFYNRMVQRGDPQIVPTQTERVAFEQVNQDEEARRLTEIVQTTTEAYIARLGVSVG
ncbi:MAG: hypothetical protein EXR62_10865 [Chloroflexi bacterium]|nr:hypothetical protein [Chloroflexota bacterium]